MTRSRVLEGVEWPESTGEPLVEGCVQVWSAPLDVSDADVECLERNLSPDEHIRGSRWRVESHARRFVVARGILRRLLGAYTDADPSAVQLSADTRGKPALSDGGASAVEFNVSHSGDLALYAFTIGSPVGVDVEELRELRDMHALAARVFSERERDAFERLAPAEQPQAFLSTWTRKEAFVKARGTGIAAQLDGFDVSVGRGEPARLLRVAEDAAPAARWTLAHLEPARGFVGAVAVEWPHARFVCRRVGGGRSE